MTSDPSLHSPPDDLYSIRFLGTHIPHLTVTRFEGREAMNELASVDVTVYAQDVEEAALLPLLLGAQVVLAIAVPTAPGASSEISPRNVAGIVIDVALLGRTEGGRHGLRLRIAPRAWLLQKRTGTRIFQDKTAAEIATIVLGEHRVPHRVQLIGKYPVREYCVQYQETDWDFVTRLFAEEACFFWFEQPAEGEDTEVLVVADSPRTYGTLPGGAELRFRYDTGGSMILEEDMVTDFRSRAGLETTALTLRDYDFERPGLDLTTDRTALDAPLPPLGGVALEHYEHHGEYEESDVDADNVRAGVEQLRARVRTAEGQSACRRLAPGLTFQLIDHDVSTLDRAYVVTAVIHQGVAPGVSASGAPPYRNRFEAAPAEIGFCLPKPARRVRQAIVGSANANNRGYFLDSEAAVGVAERALDRAGGRRRGAWYTMEANFARRLRIELWHEHLGLDHEELFDGMASRVHWERLPPTANVGVYGAVNFKLYREERDKHLHDVTAWWAEKKAAEAAKQPFEKKPPKWIEPTDTSIRRPWWVLPDAHWDPGWDKGKDLLLDPKS